MRKRKIKEEIEDICCASGSKEDKQRFCHAPSKWIMEYDKGEYVFKQSICQSHYEVWSKQQEGNPKFKFKQI
jgi:hypothetical protein